MRQDYVPDLSSLQLLGELNYRRIRRLIRAYEEQSQWDFIVHTAGGSESRLSLILDDESQYTSQLRLSFGPTDRSNLMFACEVNMVVRLYHDAGIAEITDGHRQYQGRYPYPNDDMLYPDEKFRLNQQLADLLELCLKHGHRLSPEMLYQLA